MRVAAFLFLVFGGFLLGRWTFSSPSARANVEFRRTAQPAPAAAPAPHESLEQAVAGDDPIAVAAKIEEWLDSAKVEEFRHFCAHLDELPVPKVAGQFDSLRDAYFDAFLKRWLELDPGGGLAAISQLYRERPLEAKASTNADLLVEAVGRMMPEWTLESLSIGGVQSLPKVFHEPLRRLAASNTPAGCMALR